MALVNAVKEFQKSSPANKQAWHAFCDSTEVGKYDPTFYEPAMLTSFLEGAQILAMFSGGKGGLAGAFAGAGGSPEMSRLVNKVKEFQKASPENKQAWYAFCDTQPGRNYDPARHEPDALKTFLGGVGSSGADAAFSPEKSGLIAKVKEFQKSSAENKQAWHTFCDASDVGKYDPAYHDPEALKQFLGGVGVSTVVVATASSSIDPGKAELVAKVKQFQKSSVENKKVWHSFCDESSVGKYDPAFHEVDQLQTFLAGVGAL